MTASEDRTLQTVCASSRPKSSLWCSSLISKGVLIIRGWRKGNVGESNAHRAENGSLLSLLLTCSYVSPLTKERVKFTRCLPKCQKSKRHLTAKCNFFGSAATVCTHPSHRMRSTSTECRMVFVKSYWQMKVKCREPTVLMSACLLISLEPLTGGR